MRLGGSGRPKGGQARSQKLLGGNAGKGGKGGKGGNTGKGGKGGKGGPAADEVDRYQLEVWQEKGKKWTVVQRFGRTQMQKALQRMEELGEQVGGTAPAFGVVEVFRDGREVAVDYAPWCHVDPERQRPTKKPPGQ